MRSSSAIFLHIVFRAFSSITPLLKQPFIKVLEPYRLRHFSFLHLRAHLRHAPINRLTALCQAFSLSECLRECNLLLSPHIRKALMGIWQTEFLCRKNTVEHRNVGTRHFLQLFSALTDFVKFAAGIKKSSPTVWSGCSAAYNISTYQQPYIIVFS